eukprot:Pompholyxophrys_punicea_v1_NODE_130_length_3293_cov_5.260655.p1 type:complete len:109 gc:universal NODE_130_length_3293_cov_5.260655:199-525(+)
MTATKNAHARFVESADRSPTSVTAQKDFILVSHMHMHMGVQWKALSFCQCLIKLQNLCVCEPLSFFGIGNETQTASLVPSPFFLVKLYLQQSLGSIFQLRDLKRKKGT